MEFNLNNFTTIKKQALGPRKATEPFVSLGRTGFTFNSYIVNRTSIIKKFVQIKVDAASGKIAFVFSPFQLENSFKVSVPKKDEAFKGSASTTSKAVTNYLNDETDFVNTSIYRYRFKAEISEEQGIVMIDLRDPYTKKKINK